ncbi:hypothetical protein J1N35_013942 [Gossypium stocksii]|uniref:Uncharacterized protein n=1 Tax=Gossypium stocksii TaxID=47602 RepID=A0A9D3VVP1_9ROSI|nr:hypothetical protein J1N35_013942 [Gossypium stocksii]
MNIAEVKTPLREVWKKIVEEGLIVSDSEERSEEMRNYCEFHNRVRSTDINDMSDAATDPKSPFEQDMCLERSQDFEDDRGCSLCPDLLRMVKQDEK